MTKFFFFTDFDLLQAQGNSDVFGAVLPADTDYIAGKDRYRLGSKHKATANPLAYAMCKGQILVQQDSVTPTLVNIILKPDRQPDLGLPKIKYFIYRGILKSSLTDGINIISGGNTLTNAILASNPSTPQKVRIPTTNYTRNLI